jgi:phenylalanyl-tRNA synthetase beta chain
VAEGRIDKTLWGDREREDFFSVKADLEALLGARARTVRFVPSEEPFGAVGQTASVLMEERSVGWIARIKPSIAREMDLPGSAWVFEVEAELLFEPKLRTYGMNRRFPASYRDVAFLAPLSVSAREAEERVREYGGSLLESAELFDLFTGSSLPEGTKSLAFSLAYRHPDRTLEDEEVARAVADLRHRLEGSGLILR